MSVSVVKRVVALLWAFVLTLVRSLLALFSFRRRANDPFTLPSAHRTPADALARTHARLRPILLTPRSLTGAHAQRAQSTRTRSAASTLYEHAAPSGSGSGSAPPPGPQRTSPKLDPPDAELGLCAPGLGPGRCCDGLPDTPTTASLSVVPLTPPDRCYLAPNPSATDCPYAEPWPTRDRTGRTRLPGSPLKLSIHTTAVFSGPIGSPPPGRWSPVPVWTSTPCKAPLAGPYGRDPPAPAPPPTTLADALISRSQSSFRPYDDASSTASDTSSTDLDRHAYAWPRRAHRPDRPKRISRSRSHTDLPHLRAAYEWYDTDAYLPSPFSGLSPPRASGDSATASDADDEDEDAVPLFRLRERLARQSVIPGIGARNARTAAAAVGMSPRTRRMSEGCLLALSQSTSTPTRICIGARTRTVVSLALDGDPYAPQDWLEALSLRFSAEQGKAARAPVTG